MSTAASSTGKRNERQRWMALLACASPSTLRKCLDELSSQIRFDDLRPPEIGLVMVRARMGGTGDRFNMGEATVTRCSIRTSNGLVGHAYVAGRDLEHAELAAKLDALLQSDEHGGFLQEHLMAPLAREQEARTLARAAKIGATRVDFVTLS